MQFLRRRLGLFVRTLVSVLLIAWLIRKIDWQQLWSIARTMSVGWLIAGFFCFLPVLLIVSWRWRLLLAVHGARLSLWRVFELNMIGQFFSAFLLGTTGGDVFKIFYAARAVPQRKAAVGFTVVIDRFIGLVALLFFGVALSCSQLRLLLSTEPSRWATGVFYLFAAGAVLAVIAASVAPMLLRHDALRALARKIPFVDRGAAFFAAYEKSAHALGTNLLALAASIPSNVSFVAMGYCILRAMHLEPPVIPLGSIILIVNMLIAMPVSISGVGLREGLFIMFLRLLHIDRDHAFAFSLTFFAINLLWSFVGGAFYLLYRHETHEPAPTISEDASVFSPP